MRSEKQASAFIYYLGGMEGRVFSAIVVGLVQSTQLIQAEILPSEKWYTLLRLPHCPQHPQWLIHKVALNIFSYFNRRERKASSW